VKRGRLPIAVLLIATTAASCAFYNTFYSARKYYDRATAGEPYAIDAAVGQAAPDFGRAIEYSKKLLSNYPKSKWADDAYLLWARALLGQNDPLESIRLLEDFPDQFPKSPLLNEGHFYLGVAYRQARKYRQAIRTLDEFLERSPKHRLAPYAYIERARALMSLKEPAEAAASASKVIERFPKSKLAIRARIARADALFEAKQYDPARADYRELGRRSQSDDDRLQYLLREVDCLEAGHHYDDALALLRGAISHEHEPQPPDTTGGRQPFTQVTPGYDRYGRMLARMGTVHLRAGRLEEALAAYQRVVRDYPRDPLASEAQFRVGYAYETLGDDFDRARTEYQRVKDQGQSGFAAQASDRLHDLDLIAQFRGATGDSAGRQVEAAFLIAEQYLFELDKPDRALEEYRKIAEQHAGTAAAAKALNAEAWVLSRKLDRKAVADSLFWVVVNKYPATEAQLAARDYLEMSGKAVPESLIKLPEPTAAAAPDTTPALAIPPQNVPGIGTPFGPARDSLGRITPRRPSFLPPGLDRPPVPGDSSPGFSGDTPSTPGSGEPRRPAPPPPIGPAPRTPPDTTAHPPAPRDTSRSPR